MNQWLFFLVLQTQNIIFFDALWLFDDTTKQLAAILDGTNDKTMVNNNVSLRWWFFTVPIHLEDYYYPWWLILIYYHQGSCKLSNNKGSAKYHHHHHLLHLHRTLFCTGCQVSNVKRQTSSVTLHSIPRHLDLLILLFEYSNALSSLWVTFITICTIRVIIFLCRVQVSSSHPFPYVQSSRILISTLC